MAGISRANPDAFPGGNVNRLRVGQILRIPDLDELAAADPALRYQQGVTLEKRGDEVGAFKAYLEAGEAATAWRNASSENFMTTATGSHATTRAP